LRGTSVLSAGGAVVAPGATGVVAGGVAEGADDAAGAATAGFGAGTSGPLTPHPVMAIAVQSATMSAMARLRRCVAICFTIAANRSTP
jgi:hypothetical protein